jgi:GntR family transcriptional regulator/GntR family mannosyl-D-glycerate transport/metabolism transcriptional repressor
MVRVVDPRSPTPLYRQLADLITAYIESGTLKPDQLVPSESYLMQHHGLSRGTVRAAIRLLRERHLVYTIHARGTFVRRRPQQ